LGRFRKYYWSDQIKEDEMGKACGTHGMVKTSCTIFVGKPEGKRQLGRLRHRWEDNTGMDLRDMGGELWTGCI